MKTKIAVLTILSTVSLWAVAQDNDMNNNGQGSTDNSHNQAGKSSEAWNTNSASHYQGGNTNHWGGNTNGWNSNDGMSNTNTNRHPGKHKKIENQNPPQN